MELLDKHANCLHFLNLYIEQNYYFNIVLIVNFLILNVSPFFRMAYISLQVSARF